MKRFANLAFVLVLAAPAIASAGGITAGARVDLVPLGTLHVKGGGVSSDESTAFAYGFAGQADYWVTDQISVGLAPRYLLNVKTDTANAKAATQLDIPLRVAYNHTVNEKIQAFGFGSVGYSIMFAPEDGAENSKGLVVGLGAGGRYAISDKVFATAEVGYEYVFQKTTVANVDVTAAPRLLHVGLGAGTRF